MGFDTLYLECGGQFHLKKHGSNPSLPFEQVTFQNFFLLEALKSCYWDSEQLS